MRPILQVGRGHERGLRRGVRRRLLDREAQHPQPALERLGFGLAHRDQQDGRQIAGLTLRFLFGHCG